MTAHNGRLSRRKFVLRVAVQETTILNDIAITCEDGGFLGPLIVILFIRPSEIPARYSHRQTPWIVGQLGNLFGQALTGIESVWEDPVGRLRVDQPELVNRKDYDGMGHMYLVGPKKAWVSEMRAGKACVPMARAWVDASQPTCDILWTRRPRASFDSVIEVGPCVPAAVFRQGR